MKRIFGVILITFMLIINAGCSDNIPQTGDKPADKQSGKPEDTIVTPVEKMAESSAEVMNGFVILTDVVKDAFIDVRYYSTFNFVGERIDGYEEPVILITKEAADALKLVSDDLKADGYRLKVYDAYRPQRAVNHFVRWAKDTNAIQMKPYFYPEVEKSELFQKGYIAGKSGHTRGSTVDLTIVYSDSGKDVDMGSGFDYFGEKSHFGYTGNDITPEHRKNRQILKDAMTKHGFKSIPNEWWHFTLESEPYPDMYFDFPVNSDSVAK